MLGAGVAWSIRRDGYILIATGAFTKEVLETLHDGIALLDADGNIRSCNGALARLVGCLSRSTGGGRGHAYGHDRQRQRDVWRP